ncbi:hypothetical protein UlMin_022111 [Ulmus minor]
MAREQEDVITFSAKDRQHNFLHDKPLYVEAKANELGVRRALVDNGASVNLMPKSIFEALPHGQDRLIPHEVTLSGFDSNKSRTMGHIMVDLKVGPIREAGKLIDYDGVGGTGEQPGPRVFTVDEEKGKEIKLPPEGPKEQANQLEEVNLSNTSEPRTVLISKELTGDLRKAIIDTLRKNKDLFAWTYEEMPGLDASLVTHKLAVTPAQKPKKNGTIRCCVDYRDLNKACPKDEFPLPNIDTLIDATAGHEMFSFMDGFSGYNQIKMAPEDAEKTAFRTPFGNFHYVVMPFGLKNAGATYQRAMTAIFHDMIHDFVEDYVDDLVVKSRRAIDHIAHLQKVFDRCRKYKLKMNPKKCAFGVNMENSWE